VVVAAAAVVEVKGPFSEDRQYWFLFSMIKESSSNRLEVEIRVHSHLLWQKKRNRVMATNITVRKL